MASNLSQGTDQLLLRHIVLPHHLIVSQYDVICIAARHLYHSKTSLVVCAISTPMINGWIFHPCLAACTELQMSTLLLYYREIMGLNVLVHKQIHISNEIYSEPLLDC